MPTPTNSSSLQNIAAPHRSRLTDAHVLVFGGTSGVGFAVANMALSNGATVVISGSRQTKVDEKVQLLRSLYDSIPPERISGHAVDLLDSENLEANLEAMLNKVTQHGSKKVDHIAFTAGDSHVLHKLSEVTLENAMHGSRIRLIAPLMIAKLVNTGTYMPLSANSSFTLTGGVGTTKPLPGWFMPAAWGASAEGLTRGLAVDLAPLRVNIVKPGAIQTEMLQGMLGTGKEVIEAMKHVNLLGAIGQPEDIAEAYGWIMKDRFVTGTEVACDGGQVLFSANTIY
ncbi:NAD(P)-binding protein [Phaeosphaeriaceae sp. SRC1lsM3a]|nr:NAD(P)-binding protein [Stagonospora sp. SRC1lsM3a]